MAGIRDSFLDLERQRQKLEVQVEQLRKSLGYWRNWDADYEMIKEQLSGIPEASRKDKKALEDVKKTVDSDVVTTKELDAIFGKMGKIKSFAQILSTLNGRIDTGAKNVASLEKSLEATENKLAGIQVIMNPEAEDEEGNPVTDIIEELDEDDNVISYRLQKPGDNSLQIKELLQKAGVKDILESDGQKAMEKLAAESVKLSQDSQATLTQQFKKKKNNKSREKLQLSEKQKTLDKKAAEAKAAQPPKPAEKSTEKLTPTKSQLSDKTTSETHPKPLPDGPINPTVQRVQNIMETARAQEEAAKQPAVIPENESEEDAQMRADMLKYGLGEVGAVVAEMFIDEDDQDWTDEYEEYESDESDEFGKSKYSVITDDYRQHMLELEKRLGFQSRFTRKLEEEMANAPEEKERPGDEGIGRIVVQTNGSQPDSTPTLVPDQETTITSANSTSPSTKEPPTPITPTAPGQKSNFKKSEPASPDANDATDTLPKARKKSVHFAEMLDIAPRRPGEKSKSNVRAKIPRLDDPPTYTAQPYDDIIERKLGNNKNNRKKNGKMSAFAKALADAAAVATVAEINGQKNKGPAMTLDEISAPLGLSENRVSGASEPRPPEGEILAEKVVERPTPKKEKVVVDDEIDEWQLQNEVADEYHKRRNKIIQMNGGFAKEAEVERVRVVEGPVKRVSRFKAARLSQQ